MRDNNERGAALVEMAFIAPMVLLLLMGVVEFGWKFGEATELRHAGREAARYAAVSAPDLTGDGSFTSADIGKAVCDSLNLSSTGNADITITQVTGDEIGDTARIDITVATGSLTGAPIISSFVPTSLSDSAIFRLEQPAAWSGATLTGQC